MQTAVQLRSKHSSIREERPLLQVYPLSLPSKCTTELGANLTMMATAQMKSAPSSCYLPSVINSMTRRPSPPHSELGLPSSIQYFDTRSNYHQMHKIHLLSISFLMIYKWRNYGAKRMLLVGQKLSRPAETPPSALADPSKGSLPPSSVLTTIIIVILALRR